MSEFVEGKNAVREAIEAGVTVRRLLVAEGAQVKGALGRLLKDAESKGLEVLFVPREELDAISARGAHQGVVAEVDEFTYAELADVIAGEEDSLIVVLDHVIDPGNLGAVIRSTEALGGAAVVIPKARAASVGAVALKTSSGAAMHLPVVRVPNIPRALEDLKRSGYWVLGAAGEGETPVWDAPLFGKVALVLGSEGGGLSRLVRERCDHVVSIPLEGRTSSLNVAQAATVFLYEWARRRSVGGERV